jgi:hypothetical protein
LLLFSGHHVNQIAYRYTILWDATDLLPEI